MSLPVLIGYTAKRITPRPEKFESDTVIEIASVSNCIADRPTGWLEQWKHNEWFVYDTPDLARQVARDVGAFDWPIVAYFVLPVRFDPVGEVPLHITTTATPLPSYFERLGWDVVSRSITPEFECSPLSCNGLAIDMPVNSVCLLSSVDEAIALARHCAHEQPEPGSYFVIEVWRELIAA